MKIDIAGYNITRRLEDFYASSLFLATHRDSGRPALIKTLNATYPTRRNIKRLEREYWLLSQFDKNDGVVLASTLCHHGNGNPAIISETDGLPLTHFLTDGSYKTWSLGQILDLAIQLSETIDTVHARGIVHKNIAPQNILISAGDRPVRLMNFEIATVLSREHQDRSIAEQLESSLPYISPEQTGRMSHDLDYRSDFYSLGIVLYQLLVGTLPFDADSRMGWIHAHIGKQAQIPAQTERNLPEPLIEIVLRLIAKSPDDRYQSSFGLLQDLRECQRRLFTQGRIAPFAIAQQDISEVFHIPQVLFGREDELARLIQLFEKVEHGSTEIYLISGPSGLGKSALVDELNKPVVRSRGYFLRGKFDQFERAKPYAAISAAFSGLAHELLTESSERLEFWRENIQEVLGANAQAFIDIVPDMEKIIGPQPPVPALPPTEAQNRLQIVFLNFVRLLARPERPLVLYLDDLQWSDGPTLNLLVKLATSREITNFFIIGAYRSNEVSGNHMLNLARDEIARSRKITEMKLAPLNLAAVNQIVASSLRSRGPDIEALAQLLFQKTEGNPFFVVELLKSMTEDGLIRFDRSQGRWTWDIDEVAHVETSDNVVEFLIANLGKLSDETKDALRLAACIGYDFDLRTLSVVHQRPMRELGTAMMSALRRNVIRPLDDGYQYFDQATDDLDNLADTEINPRFQFQHDRLHQAAYELIDDQEKQLVHLSIGRLLQNEASDDPNAEQIIKIVRHLNHAGKLITDPDEREKLAGLNLAAGQFAHDASSYPAALHYLEMGRSLLRPDAWTNQYGITSGLSSLYAQTAYLNGLHQGADTELDVALAQVRTPLEKAQVLSMRTRHYSTLGRMQDSIDTALQGLRLLGIDIDIDISDETVAAELADIDRNRADRKIADLINTNRMTDPNVSVAVGLLMEIFPPAFLSGAGNLFHFLVARSVNLSLIHGNSAETAFAYAAYGMLLSGALNDQRQGYEYGKLALAMNESFDDIGLKSRIIYLYGMFIHHWSNHWSSMTNWFQKGIEAGYQSGDLLYLAYNAQDCVIWDPTLDLENAITEQRKYLDIVKECNYQDSFDSGSLFLQMQLNFAGQTDGRYSLNDDSFDEQSCYDGMQSRRFLTGVANYHIYKAEIHYLYGDHAGAHEHVQAADDLAGSFMSLPQSTRSCFIGFLTVAALLPNATPAEKIKFQQRLERDLLQMQVWSENCPENFSHLELAMQAGLDRIAGDHMIALQLYEQAIDAARRNRFLRDEAMINEQIADTLRHLGLQRAADAHLTAARHLYDRWGAKRKVNQIDAAHPGLLGLTGPVRSKEDDEAQAGTGNTQFDGGQESLDLSSVMKAAQAISGEIVLSRLLARTMTILLESAGAQRGVFATSSDAQLSIEVECAVKDGDVVVVEDRKDMETARVIPKTIVNYVLRTRTSVVLENAAESTQFANDPYIIERATKSVICVPIVRPGHFEGAIYLENDLAFGAFPRNRIAIVEMLAAQASISIENAKFYVELEEKVNQRTDELSQKSTALERVTMQLSKYLSPQVYQSIFDSKKEVKLTSERKRLTIFFSDLVGFTETADRLESEELTQLLNHYLTEMSEIALSFGATIDKFVGDAIVIFFGDPETRGVKDDALACVKMAIAMRNRLAELHKIWLDQGLARPLEIRIGINTGYCTVGNFGSEARMDYTIIGGEVNLTSRLETAASPNNILISHATYAQIKDQIHCKEHSEMSVRGISHPVTTYEVVDLIENLRELGDPIHEDLPHLKLDVDMGNMTRKERLDAAEKLREAAVQLEKSACPQRGTAGSS